MSSTDLAFASTQELIDELMRRTSFLGVVIQSAEEYRGTWEGERNFRVHFNSNLAIEEASGLLDAVSKYIDLNLC